MQKGIEISAKINGVTSLQSFQFTALRIPTKKTFKLGDNEALTEITSQSQLEGNSLKKRNKISSIND